MIKDAFLFYYTKIDPKNVYRIKNLALRNKIPLEYRPYYNETDWKDFLKSANVAYRDLILEEGINLGQNFQGFILVYNDLVLNKQQIITNTETILELLQ